MLSSFLDWDTQSHGDPSLRIAGRRSLPVRLFRAATRAARPTDFDRSSLIACASPLDRMDNFPRTVGRFALRERLLDSGAPDLFVAQDPRGDTSVLLQFATIDEPTMRDAWLAEAGRLARMRHAGVAEIIDFGIDGTRVFVASARVPGVLLRRLIDRRETNDWTVADRVRVVGALCDVLAASRAAAVERVACTPTVIWITDPARTPLLLAMPLATVDALRESPDPRTEDFCSLAPELLEVTLLGLL